MAFGLELNSGGGDFLPRVEYKPQRGVMLRIDRIQDQGGQWDKDEVDITSGFKAVVDMEEFMVGLIDIGAGRAPRFKLIPHKSLAKGASLPRDEDPLFKQGVQCLMKLSSHSGGDVRQLSSNSVTFLKGFRELYEKYEAAVPANQGKLPIVELKKVEKLVSGSGPKTSTNFKPVFEIVGWAARPADLPTADAPATKPSTPPATGSTPVGAPTAKAKRAEMADDDFG